MSDETFRAVDRYLEDLFVGDDESLQGALTRADEAGLPAIAVSPMLGRLLQVLVRSAGARRVLEIGTLAAYSTIHLARGLPDDGEIVTVELDADHAEVARANLEAAGFGGSVDVRVGRAIDVLGALMTERAGPFDVIFLDADKGPYADYLEAAIALSRSGTVIVADNVVRAGRVLTPDVDDAAAGVHRFNAALAADDRLTGTVIQTVGAKGHDGMAIAVVH